jgi:sodium-independent sulfate anion transporter 11
VDASQELFALGFSNILSSFVRSFPLAGSFSRTAVNNASGVKTPLGGLMTGKETELITSFSVIII